MLTNEQARLLSYINSHSDARFNDAVQVCGKPKRFTEYRRTLEFLVGKGYVTPFDAQTNNLTMKASQEGLQALEEYRRLALSDRRSKIAIGISIVAVIISVLALGWDVFTKLISG